MIWILITLIATVSWGFTDLFSKMSVDYNDKDFYIKLTIWTGLATGVLLILILPFSESKMPVVELAEKYMLFIPTTLLYIYYPLYWDLWGSNIWSFRFFRLYRMLPAEWPC